MNESSTNRSLYERIDALPLCLGKRSALIDELRHAEHRASDIVCAERCVHAIVRRAYDALARWSRRVIAKRGSFPSRSEPRRLPDEA